MSIPLSAIVQVIPSVLAAAGSAVDLNGLILTQSTAAPIGTVVSFSTAADVGTYFGLSSTEYSMASVYFNGYDGRTATPGTLYFTQYNTSAAAGWMRGGSLASVSLATLQTYSGVLTVTVDGTSKTSSTITLSGATSFSNAATLIQAGFTSLGGTVTWDSQRSAFLFTSSTTGATSSVTVASGTLAASLKLTAATGATVSPGASTAVASTFLTTLTQTWQNWALFTTTWEPASADEQAFAAWVSAQNSRYGYVAWDSDVNAKTAGSTSTFMYSVLSAGQKGVIPVWGDYTHAAFVLGYAAALNFSRYNGRATLAFKQQSGLLPAVTTSADASALTANGYNFYGQYANAKSQWNFMSNGSTSGRDTGGANIWLDTFLNAIWLNSNLQLAMANMLMSYGSIPYNADGYAAIAAAAMDPIETAVTFGAIRTGVTLSNSQKQQVISIVGSDVSSSISAKGYYLKIWDAPASVRVARQSPTITLLYTDGQSIQQIVISSVEIQ